MQPLYIATIIDKSESATFFSTLADFNPEELIKNVDSFLASEDKTRNLQLSYDRDALLQEIRNGGSLDTPFVITHDEPGEFLICCKICDSLDNPLVSSARQLNTEIPWHRFGDGEPTPSCRQYVFGDLMDWIRDTTGNKDVNLAYMLLGKRAAELHWDGKECDAPYKGTLHIAFLGERIGAKITTFECMASGSAHDTTRRICELLATKEKQQGITILYDPDTIDKEFRKPNITEKEPLVLPIASPNPDAPLEEKGHDFWLTTYQFEDIPEEIFNKYMRVQELCPIRLDAEEINNPQQAFNRFYETIYNTMKAPDRHILDLASIGHKAIELGWNCLPSPDKAADIIRKVNAILTKNGKRCALGLPTWTPQGRMDVELTEYDEDGTIKDMRVLSDMAFLRYAESILEEEKGILPL